jgi:hypothetical protein
VSRELLAWLKEKFPDRVPRLADTDREVWAAVGRQDLIRYLQGLYDAQETT